MKTLHTFLLMIISLGSMIAQSKEIPSAKNSTTNKPCTLVFSEDEQALVYRNESIHGQDIFIESLPEYGEEAIPVEIAQNEKGSYTFKKHPSLNIPEFYSVVITDKVTGARFDLKAADSYTFDINKATPERFMLSMSKIKTKMTSMN